MSSIALRPKSGFTARMRGNQVLRTNPEIGANDAMNVAVTFKTEPVS